MRAAYFTMLLYQWWNPITIPNIVIVLIGPCRYGGIMVVRIENLTKISIHLNLLSR